MFRSSVAVFYLLREGLFYSITEVMAGKRTEATGDPLAP
jgi:hypothetical protein